MNTFDPKNCRYSSQWRVDNAEKKILARWESRSGKDWVELYQDGSEVYSYRANGSGGFLHAKSDSEAIIQMEKRIKEGGFQPDSAKTPMRRV